jgi:hypothetical protein
MSNLTADMVNTQLHRVDADVRSVVVRKICKRRLTGPSSAMCKHSRMKHHKPLADAQDQIDLPTSTPLSDMPASNQLSDNPTNNPLPPDQSQGSVVDMHKVAHPLSEKRANDAARYLSLCAASPLAFRRAIDTLPTSSIIRIYELVCTAAKGDGQAKLSPKQLACASSMERIPARLRRRSVACCVARANKRFAQSLHR